MLCLALDGVKWLGYRAEMLVAVRGAPLSVPGLQSVRSHGCTILDFLGSVVVIGARTTSASPMSSTTRAGRLFRGSKPDCGNSTTVMHLKIPGFSKSTDAAPNVGFPGDKKPGLFSCSTVDVSTLRGQPCSRSKEARRAMRGPPPWRRSCSRGHLGRASTS
jgi:hypothetical protein